jgi:hypothetical protein
MNHTNKIELLLRGGVVLSGVGVRASSQLTGRVVMHNVSLLYGRRKPYRMPLWWRLSYASILLARGGQSWSRNLQEGPTNLISDRLDVLVLLSILC